MISEKKVRDKLDETVNRLNSILAKMEDNPRDKQALVIIRTVFDARIKTLQEVLEIGIWDEKEVSEIYKLDSRHWQ